MDFGFSEDQEALRAQARKLLEAECPMPYVRKMMEDDTGYSEEQWKRMAGLGWMGLTFPEPLGGVGLDMVDLVVVLEEMGRVVMPDPFFSTVVLGGLALDLAGSKAHKTRYLSPLARGELKATLAQVEESGRWDADGIQIHGGIGFTWEHDMHLYFKRVKGSEVTYGDGTWNRELVAQVVLDGTEEGLRA